MAKIEKTHAKHRSIPQAVINHPVYKGMKAKSKAPHRFDMWEESTVAGLHVFEWIVIVAIGLVVFAVVNYLPDMMASGKDWDGDTGK